MLFLPVQIAEAREDVEERHVMLLKVLVQRDELAAVHDAEVGLFDLVDVADVYRRNGVVRNQAQGIVEEQVRQIDQHGQRQSSRAIGRAEG